MYHGRGELVHLVWGSNHVVGLQRDAEILICVFSYFAHEHLPL